MTSLGTSKNKQLEVTQTRGNLGGDQGATCRITGKAKGPAQYGHKPGSSEGSSVAGSAPLSSSGTAAGINFSLLVTLLVTPIQGRHSTVWLAWDMGLSLGRGGQNPEERAPRPCGLRSMFEKEEEWSPGSQNMPVPTRIQVSSVSAWALHPPQLRVPFPNPLLLLSFPLC